MGVGDACNRERPKISKKEKIDKRVDERGGGFRMSNCEFSRRLTGQRGKGAKALAAPIIERTGSVQKGQTLMRKKEGPPRIERKICGEKYPR